MSANAFKSLFAIIPIGSHTRVGVDTVQTLTAPEDASILLLEADGQNVRYRLDGGTPTATVGFLLETTDNVIRLDLYNNVSIQVIGVSAGGFVNYQWARVNR